MTLTRYLLNISYIGTYFRAAQKQSINTNPALLDPDSVQGALEVALTKLGFSNEPKVFISSRTDKGVHALHSSVHVDLQQADGKVRDSVQLQCHLNKYFERNKVGLRIQKCQIVPNTFHARFSAKSRLYLYRLAVRKQDSPPLNSFNKSLSAEIPFIEWKRCYFIQNQNFDICQAREVSSMFIGEKDFRTFMGSTKNNTTTIRNIIEVDINPGGIMFNNQYIESYNNYNFWDITIKGSSFLYNQVRRMAGTLVAVAQNQITKNDVQYMLDVPSSKSWLSKILTLPAYGLYLVKVEYDPKDLEFTDSSN